MWITKYERRLLAGYYRKIEDAYKQAVYRYDDLHPLLNWLSLWPPPLKWFVTRKTIPTDAPIDEKNYEKQIKRLLATRHRLERANKLLEERKLIALKSHETDRDACAIKLTLEGYDLGRRYASWWTCSGLWFQEYKNHWIWVIISFLGGVLGGFISSWLTRRP